MICTNLKAGETGREAFSQDLSLSQWIWVKRKTKTGYHHPLLKIILRFLTETKALEQN